MRKDQKLSDMEKSQQFRKDVVFALDIGTTKVVALAGRRDEYDRIEILAVSTVESTGVLRGMVSNIDKTVNAITKAISHVERKCGVQATEVVVGIAGSHIRSIQHRGVHTRENSDMEIGESDIRKLKKDMHKIVLSPGDKIIHVIPQDYTVDNEYGILDPKGMSGVRLEANFHIITGQHTAFNNIKRCVEKAGLKVTDIILEPIASGKAVLSPDEMEAGVAIVDIGGGTTDLTVIHENVIRHTGVIPFGGSSVTKDIKEGCIVMNDQAEKLKTKFGYAVAEKLMGDQIITIPGIKGREAKELSQKNISRIIQARMEEIFDYVLKELEASGYYKKLIAGVVLTGGGANLKCVKDLASYHLSLSTRVGMPIENLAHGYPKLIADPLYSTAVGLLIHAIEENQKLPAPPKVHQNSNTGENISTDGGEVLEGSGIPGSTVKKGFFDKLFNQAVEILSPKTDRDLY